MFEPTTIFQRSHAGRTEIHEKKCGLTQSERLVLIMIDGVASYSGVRAKLPVLTDDRFERATRTLLRKELILEVFMRVEDPVPEVVERSVIDMFLQQDPMDPVTILMLDDDEGFPELDHSSSIKRPAWADQPPSAEFSIPRARPADEKAPPPAPIFAPAIDEHDALIADEIGQAARARHQERATTAPPPPAPPSTSMESIHQFERSEQGAQTELGKPPHSANPLKGEGAMWYWMFSIGCAFLLGYALARLSV